jgi:hypothetical protein
VNAVSVIPSGSRILAPHDIAESLAGDALHHHAGPVDVAAVLPALARIEQQRRLDRLPRRIDHPGLALLVREARVRFVEEVVGEAGGMREQMARGHVATRGAQLRFAVGAEALYHHDVPQLGHVLLGGRVEVEQAFLDQLQARRAGDGLGGREDRAHGVGLERFPAPGVADAASAFVDRAAAVGHRRRHPGHAWRGRGDAVQHGVDRFLSGLSMSSPVGDWVVRRGTGSTRVAGCLRVLATRTSTERSSGDRACDGGTVTSKANRR